MNLDKEVEVIAFEKPDPDSYLSLLPCPFCGSSDVVYEKYKHLAGERWAVLCLGCMAEINPGYAQQKYVVRDMWNQRTVVE